MYQLVLQRFGYFNAIQLSDPVPLQELITLALKEEDPDSDGIENDDLKGKIAEVRLPVNCFTLLSIFSVLLYYN